MKRNRSVIPVKALALAALLIACTPARPALVFSPTELPGAQTGQPYSVTITVSQNQTPVGDMNVSAGSPPPGLTLAFAGRGQGASADLSGTPTAAGTYTFNVSAWCLGTNISGQSGEQAYTLVVN
jgi:large repetitive protein